MEQLLQQKIDLNKLDKSGWKPYRFDKIAKNISERVDPNNTDLEIYVGLEHLDSEDIHIRRKGTKDDVNGTKLRCYPGDVIFGRRRAYQRKAAIVDFDGFCSAHSLVLRANPEVIDPKLFPFFLHSDQFMHRAVDISVGSLSPTINWGTLKVQEFLLPPKEQQPQLAELLWAMDELVEREKSLCESVLLNKKSIQKSLYDKAYRQRVRLSHYTSVLGGYAFPSKAFVNEGTPVVKIKNIVHGIIVMDKESNHIRKTDFSNLSKYELFQGDLLIAMTGATLGKVGVVQEEYQGALLNQRVGKFQLLDDSSKFFLRGILDSSYFLTELHRYIGVGAQGNISSDDIAKTMVPEVDSQEMIRLGKQFNQLYQSLEIIDEKIVSSQSILKSLVNQIF